AIEFSIDFDIDEKEYGEKFIAYDTLLYEDTRGNRYNYEITPTKIQVGTQSGIFAGTIIQKAPKEKSKVGARTLEITEEEKKSIDKLKAKKHLFQDLLRKNEENLNKKIINNEEYMAIYVKYREKLEEIDKYLKDLGYTEKGKYTEVTCLYDGSKIFIEDGQCMKCGDLYTMFFDEIISILYFMIIHQSGICIFNKGFGKELDADLTSGLLTAVQSFMGELTGQEKTKFTEFSQSGFNILTCNSKYTTAALVMSMRATDRIKDRLIQFLELFENKFENKLTVFSGNLDDFAGSFDILEQVIPINLLRPHQINYELFHDIKFSSVTQKIIEKVPEIKEKRQERIFLDNLIEIIRKKLRRLEYEKIIASILELKEKNILTLEEVPLEEEISEPVLVPITEPPGEPAADTMIESVNGPLEEELIEEMPRFCVECGAKLPKEKEKIQFCINCGARQPD
ncbi:MAG: zinc ribbon domain-containing protein, partial [Promethearchaeota archaeon]